MEGFPARKEITMSSCSSLRWKREEEEEEREGVAEVRDMVADCCATPGEKEG